MERKMLLELKADGLRQLKLFGDVIERYCPDGNIAGGKTVGELKAILPEGDAFVNALTEAFARYEEVTREEVKAFGVDIDPHGLRYQWGKPDINEKVVSLIEESDRPVKKGGIVFYGPSNIAQWYSLERDMQPYTAYNHGIGGCIDDDMMRYAPRLLYAYEPSVVFFQTGSNDIASGIPLETILGNKRKMYGMFLKNMPQAALVVCSGLPLPGRTQFWDATVKTNELLKNMCAETDRLYFLDATDDMLTDEGPVSLKTSSGRFFDPAKYRIDGIHLNKHGHDVWTRLMKEKLKELL